MKDKMRSICITLVLCAVGLMTAPSGFAQFGVLPPPLEGPVVNANYPISNPPLKDNCDYVCAQEFTIGGTGAYLNRMDLGLVGTNYTSTPITCTFDVWIFGVEPNGAVGLPAYLKTETVTVPGNTTQNSITTVAIPLYQPLDLWLGPGNFYLLVNKGTPAVNGNPSTGCNATLNGGSQANPPADLDWNRDYLLGAPNVGPGHFGMFNESDPNSWGNLFGMFTFDLDGPTLLPPPVGGGALQIARLIVKGPVTPPIGGPVEAQVGFLNARTGALLGPLTPIAIGPGTPQLQSVDLNLTPFISRIGQRIEVQPVIVQMPGAVSPGPINTPGTCDPAENPGECNPGPINISVTVQMLDQVTGFESQLIPVPQPAERDPGPVQQPGERDPGPINVPALDPQILAGGQTMRFDITATQTDPCVAQVRFNDANGNPLIPSVPVNLAPGTGTTVDLNADTLGFRVGTRTEVQPVLVPAVPAAAVAGNSVCNASVEVFDHLTGRTWSHQSTMVGLSAAPPPADGTSGTPGVPSSSAGTN